MRDMLPPLAGYCVWKHRYAKGGIFMRIQDKHGIWVVWAICLCLAGGAVLTATWLTTFSRENSTAHTAKTTAHLEDQSPLLSFPLMLQDPQLPNGCEVTSLAMLLTWAGYPVDKMELYEGYLPRQDFTYDPDGELVGGDPEEVYVGDAASQWGGWYCFQGPIVEAGNAYLSQQGSDQHLEAISGLDPRTLEESLDAGTPVLVWVTLDYTPPVSSSRNWCLPDGSLYIPYSNLHCVVVADYEEEGYLTADPLEGWRWVEKTTFWDVFAAMGHRAVAFTE